jgi:hypothetical protein
MICVMAQTTTLSVNNGGVVVNTNTSITFPQPLNATNLILAPGGILNITNIPPLTISSNTFSLVTFTNGMPAFSYRLGWSNACLISIMNSNGITFMKQLAP